jgi:putative Mg2+ transporter-C (MgtC) family protein
MNFDNFYQAITSSTVSVESAVFKIFLSFIAGGLVGLNRERHKQPAGFRTHILICMGSALLMILSIYIPQTFFEFKSGDPARIAAQVVTGIGFLGAGAIIRLGNNVKGLTTAASIWLISAIGLSIGAGIYIISFITLVFTLFTLIVLDKVEHRWFPQYLSKTIHLEFDGSNYPDPEIKDILKKFRISITDYNINVQNGKPEHTEVNFLVKISERIDLSKLINKFHKLSKLKVVNIS